MSVQTVRADWERAASELEAESKEPRRRQQLLDAVDAVTAELRARVGQTYTLEELVEAYGDVGSAGAATRSGSARPTTAGRATSRLRVDAAFHAYARGAVDFEP